MIREADVRSAVEALPDACWLKHYVRYGPTQVASHIGYHLAVGLALIGATTARDFESLGFKKATFTNQYVLIVGASGDAEKTLAIDVGLDMLTDAAPHLIAGDPVSEQALLRTLTATPTCLLPYPEFATFLSATGGRDNHRGRTIRDQLTNIYDGRSITKPYAKEEDALVVTNPRVSLIGACTPQHLETLTVHLDWEGGMISRFFIMFGDRERQVPWPTPDPPMRQWLAGWLACAATHPNAGRCTGLDEDAKSLWLWWYEDIINRHRGRLSNQQVVGLVSRARLQAAKIATALAWSSGIGWDPTQTWSVPRWALECAIRIVDLHLHSAFDLVARIQPTHDMREQRAVLYAVGATPTALGTVTKEAKVDLRDAKRHLATLAEQGEVVVVSDRSNKLFYQRVEGGAPPAYEAALELPPPPPSDVH